MNVFKLDQLWKNIHDSRQVLLINMRHIFKQAFSRIDIARAISKTKRCFESSDILITLNQSNSLSIIQLK
jgi:hypothetical protein